MKSTTKLLLINFFSFSFHLASFMRRSSTSTADGNCQVEPVVNSNSAIRKPMLFVANHWNDASDTPVRVFSNCDEVELLVNGRSAGRQRPDKDEYSTRLKHPPFTFHLPAFTAGTLTAVGYINDKKMVQQIVRTPGAAARLKLRIDYSGKNLAAGKNDVVFGYADVTDANGTVVPEANPMIGFSVQGDGEIIGPSSVKAEAGIATILLKAGTKPLPIKVVVKAADLAGNELLLRSD